MFVLSAHILIVPIFRNDLSPFLVLIITALVSLFLVVLIHQAAILSERLDLADHYRMPPPAMWRPARMRVESRYRIEMRAIGIMRRLRALIARRPFEIAGCMGTDVTIVPVIGLFVRLSPRMTSR